MSLYLSPAKESGWRKRLIYMLPTKTRGFAPQTHGQETKHVKTGHVKIDRAHFRVHFRDHWKNSREHSRGSLRGDPLVRFTQKKPQPSWAFPWPSSCTFSGALSRESSWVKFRSSRALCFSEPKKSTKKTNMKGVTHEKIPFAKNTIFTIPILELMQRRNLRRAQPTVRKILVSVKFLSAILGPEMAARILWTPGKMRPFYRKSHVHKIPRFRGGGILGLGGRGEKCRFYFYGREDFLILLRNLYIQGEEDLLQRTLLLVNFWRIGNHPTLPPPASARNSSNIRKQSRSYMGLK